MKMNPEIRARWTEALRSGKYSQTKDYLHVVSNGDPADGEAPGYCCLGVLCELAVQEGVIAKEERYLGPESDGVILERYGVFDASPRMYQVHDRILPQAVVEWAGIEDPENPNQPCVENDRGRQSLTHLNDASGLGFDEIAAIIEKDGHNHEETN